MQKLVFTNSLGESVDLTKAPFGITNWKGLDNTKLTWQTQQVPNHDGSVFIDALMNDRDLSFTVAVQDNNNLELRYQLKYELIQKLNPKLGEGYLVYTNDYLSRRIKVVPQIPLFANKNSNDRGTLKASVVFTANDPYWEDVEETTVELKSNVRNIINNDGETKINIKCISYGNSRNNLKLENFTTEKKIQIDGTTNNFIDINTMFGQKNVQEKMFVLDYIKGIGTIKGIVYAKNLMLYVAITEEGVISTSINGTDWITKNKIFASHFVKILYNEGVLAIAQEDGDIIISRDGDNWEKSSNVGFNINDFIYSSKDKFVAIGDEGYIATSSDLVNWSTNKAFNQYVYKIIYDEGKDLYIIYKALENSSDAQLYWGHTLDNWTRCNEMFDNYHFSMKSFITTNDGKYAALGSPSGIDYNIIIRGSYYILNNVEYVSFGYHRYLDTYLENGCDILYSNVDSYFYLMGRRKFYSPDGTFDEAFISRGEELVIDDMTEVFYERGTYYSPATLFEKDNLFAAFCYNREIYTYDFSDWTNKTIATNYGTISDIVYIKEWRKYYALAHSPDVNILTSEDGLNWEVNLTIPYVGQGERNYNFVYGEGKGLFLHASDSNRFTADGKTWVSVNLSPGSIPYISAGIYAQNKFTFLSTTAIYTSEDGLNYTKTNFTFSQITKFNCIAYSEELGLYVAVGASSSPYCYYVSEDGLTWESVAINNHDLKYICYDSTIKKFLLAGTYQVLLSADGRNWTVMKNDLIPHYYVQYLEKYGVYLIDGRFISNNLTDWVELSVNSFVRSATKDGNNMIYVSEKSTIAQIRLEEVENIIDKLSVDSNMQFALAIGENQIAITDEDESDFTAVLSYRQRYIGV